MTKKTKKKDSLEGLNPSEDIELQPRTEAEGELNLSEYTFVEENTIKNFLEKEEDKNKVDSDESSVSRIDELSLELRALEQTLLKKEQDFRDRNLSTLKTEENLLDTAVVDTFITPDILLKDRDFKAVLNIYVTKNNVSWVLTDVTRANLFYKITGGNICKRGTDKDSSKTTMKNFETMIHCCEELSINHLTFRVNVGFGMKKSTKNTKNLLKILSLFRHDDIAVFEEVCKDRPACVSTVRLKGGRRGRKT